MTLRELRQLSGKNVKDVASVLKITSQALSNYESGIRRIDIEKVLTLSELYEVSEGEIIRAQLNSLR